MRLYLFYFIFLFTFCSTEPTTEPNAKTLESQVDSTETIEPYQLQKEDDLHIDYVQYLEETDEYAVALLWKKEADVLFWYDSIQRGLNDIIYSNDLDYTRYKIPDSLLAQYFDIKHLKHIKLYDRENRYCGAGKFQRFEFIDQNIDPKPVAVYKLNSENKDALYVVAGLKIIVPEIPSVEASKTRLNQLIEFKLPKKYKEAYSLRNGFLGKRFYSIQGYQENGFKIYSELYLEENGKLEKVHENAEFWYYFDVHPIPIYNKQQPLLLCNLGKAETDWFQSTVLIFKEGKYVDVP